MPIVGLLAIAFLIFMIYCACTESRRVGTYKAFQIFGRFDAYLVMLFFCCGLLPIVPFLEDGDFGTGKTILYILGGILAVILGVLKCRSISRKCGQIMPILQKHCVRDLIFCGIGMSIKVVFFFISAFWAVYGPEEVFDSNGQRLYRIGNDVHNERGELVGRMDGQDRFIPNRNYY